MTLNRVDPSTVLNDDLMAHIFSFVGGGQGKRRTKANIEPTILQCPGEGSFRLLGLEEAGRLQSSTVARVCKPWQKICKENMSLILGPLHGTFNTLGSEKRILACMNWMIKYKLRIGSLYFYTHRDVSLVTKLLKECDTTDLQKMAVNLHVTEETPDFHTTIAEECPNLRELFISIDYESLRVGRFSRSLFSMPSIRWLYINLVVNIFDQEKRVLYVPVSGLSNLQELRLSNNDRERNPAGTCLVVQSEPLEHLNVCDLQEWTYVRCHCPKLKNFYCKGRNGTIPTRRWPGAGPYTAERTITSTAEQQSFVGLDVPPSCRISVEHYFRPYTVEESTLVQEIIMEELYCHPLSS